LDVVGNFEPKKIAMHWQNRIVLTFGSLTLHLFFDTVKQCY